MTKKVTDRASLFTGLFAAFLFTVSAVGVAFAQPLAYQNETLTSIAKGVDSTLRPTAQRLSIKNDTDYNSFFGGSPPASPTVNFATEDVIAVTMGNQPTGSSIDITRVEVRTTGFTAGAGYVHVAQVTGTSNDTGTQPYAVVKVPKGALAYLFVNDIAITPYSGPTPFNKIVYTTSGGVAPYTDSITIDSTGKVTVNRSIGSTGGTTYSGTLTPSQIQDLNTAFFNANVASLPVSISSTPLPVVLPAEIVESGLVNGEVHMTTVQQAGLYGDFGQVKALIDAMRGPAEQAVRGTQTQGFTIDGTVALTGTTLNVGGHIIAPTDPFYNLIASMTGKSVEFESPGGDTTTPVMSVEGKLTAGASLLSFPNTGASVISSLLAGSQVTVTDFTLLGTYVEVRSPDGQRGYVPKSLVDVQIQTPANTFSVSYLDGLEFTTPTALAVRDTFEVTNLQINSNTPILPSSAPNLTINYNNECWHMNNPYFCPPGVPLGSNTIGYNSIGWVLYPDGKGGTIAVDPSTLIAYQTIFPGTLGVWNSAMNAHNQIASQQTTYDQVSFPNVLFYNTGQNQNITISGLSFDDNALYNQYPGTNPSRWLTLSLSPPSHTINTPQIPYAIITNYTPTCDESFVSITPGYPTYGRARNISFNGGLYEADLPVVTLPDGSRGLSVLAIRRGSSCPNTGNSYTQAGVLTLNKVNINGTDHSVQLQRTGSTIQILSVH
ncbi:MAG: SH3 domain-containing protein [Thermodesulfovibrionales bacterium]